AEHAADLVLCDPGHDLDTEPYPLGTSEQLQETALAVEALDRRVVFAEADVRVQADVDAIVARGLAEFGKIDIVIANAGIWSLGPFWEMSEQQWGDMIETNLSGIWRTIKAVVPQMIERQSGAIVMTSSSNGYEPGRHFAHYTAAKHGVHGLMRAVALDLAPFGIRVNAVAPGAVDTGMTNWQGAYDMYAGHPGGTREEFIQGSRHFHALKGHAALNPEAIADAAAWLVSDQASTVTGIVVPVDAGHLILPGVNPAPVV
ncbi:MAG: mycofactocin-coupled SDR family oxidoreductase, partial [Pseudonocardia sp.]